MPSTDRPAVRLARGGTLRDDVVVIWRITARADTIYLTDDEWNELLLQHALIAKRQGSRSRRRGARV